MKQDIKNFHEYVIGDVLGHISDITSRAMFGGYGMYLEGGIFAIIFLGIIVISSIFIYRPYCRYICPIGALLALIAYVNRIRFVFTKESDCIRCTLAEKSCEILAMTCPSTKNALEKLHVDIGECIMCGECRYACPKNIIKIKLFE